MYMQKWACYVSLSMSGIRTAVLRYVHGGHGCVHTCRSWTCHDGGRAAKGAGRGHGGGRAAVHCLHVPAGPQAHAVKHPAPCKASRTRAAAQHACMSAQGRARRTRACADASFAAPETPRAAAALQYMSLEGRIQSAVDMLNWPASGCWISSTPPECLIQKGLRAPQRWT